MLEPYYETSKGDEQRFVTVVQDTFLDSYNMHYILAKAVRFKDRAFKDENEWRPVTHDDIYVLEVNFRRGSTTLIPYIVSPPIDSLVVEALVGPTPNARSCPKRALRLVGHGVTVSDTAIPFRVL